MSNSLIPVVFHSLCDNPADVESLTADQCRKILHWRNSVSVCHAVDYSGLLDDEARAALYLQILGAEIVAAADAIAADLHARFGSCVGECASYDDLRRIAAARTANHPESAECENWLDDLVARYGLPQELADDLLAAIADDFHVFNR